MKTSILIVSHAKDIRWAKFCLFSIKQFATGFYEVVVAVPTADIGAFADTAQATGVRLVPFDQARPPLGHLDHEVQKCMADKYCPTTDCVMHVDSDCFFRAPVTPDTYFHDGKPVLLIQDFNNAGPARCWKASTEKALGHAVKYETMRRHPAVHYLGVYENLRDAVSRAHRCHFSQYVLSQPTNPIGFSEFNCLGQIALLPQWRDRYTVINVDFAPYPQSPLVQFWSHGPLESYQDVFIDGEKHHVIPLSFMASALAKERQ